jgi:hypothetical protein
MKYRAKIIGLIFNGFILIILMGISPDIAASGSDSPPTIGVTAAGVPKYWGETRDYDQWFGELAAAGVTAFLPYSAYQEAPEPLSLGYEVDFFPPCSYDDAAFQALRTQHIQLLVAGEVLYADGFPPLEEDPLRALMACAGEGMISAVLSIDEPGINQTNDSDPTENARALYERVKAIDPALPVMMVHAPIPDAVTEAEVDEYLSNVSAFSAYADIIGFDLYPIPTESASLIAPDLGLTPVGYTEAFPAYLGWLQEVADGRPYFLVLQAFSFERQVSAEIAQEIRDAGYLMRFPTEAELQDMACLAVEGGVSEIAWWGQSLLIEEDAAFWESVLAVTQGITIDADAYC